MSDDGDGLLDRWARRKRAVAEEARQTAPPLDAEDDPPKPDETLSEPELLEKLGLPDPDTLGTGDDFKAFMARNVPDYLRQRALRRLWVSNPVLANVDGLVDYGGDFTDAAMVPEVLTTAYRVGKGFLQRDADEDPAEDIPDAAETDAHTEVAAAPEPETDDPGEPLKSDLQDPLDSDPAPPRPRRMAFRTG